jgi:hypothetical protein
MPAPGSGAAAATTNTGPAVFVSLCGLLGCVRSLGHGRLKRKHRYCPVQSPNSKLAKNTRREAKCVERYVRVMVVGSFAVGIWFMDCRRDSNLLKLDQRLRQAKATEGDSEILVSDTTGKY